MAFLSSLQGKLIATSIMIVVVVALAGAVFVIARWGDQRQPQQLRQRRRDATCAHSVSVAPFLTPGPENTSGARDCTTSNAPCCPACRPNAYDFGLIAMSGAFGLSNSCAIRSYASG